MTAQEARSAKCPPPDTMPGCPCYNFEDGLFLECAGATEESLRTALSGVIHAAEGEGTCTMANEYIRINKGLRVRPTGISLSPRCPLNRDNKTNNKPLRIVINLDLC